MPSQHTPDDARPLLVCLHFLGGSRRSWEPVERHLGQDVRCLALDLPGFGDASKETGSAVQDMADGAAAAVRKTGVGRWWIAGHSMGAKVAMVLARKAQDGEPGLEGLCGMMLVAGSPPEPEPLPEDRRADMLGWFNGDAATSRAQAEGYIEAGVEHRLDEDLFASAVGDVLRANTDAWRAWLQSGSLEDWSTAVGMLRVPTLVLAGSADPELGPEAQKLLVQRHLEDARLVTLPGAGHLLPLECPEEVAKCIAGHLRDTDTPYRQLIASDRVSRNTRALLLPRLVPDDPAYRPRALTPARLVTLRALLERVLPQKGSGIDLAARLDGQLADSVGDGWRFASLPADAEAYGLGLDTLDTLASGSFAALSSEQQDSLLAKVADGKAAGGDHLLNGLQMQNWFEDVRSDAVRLYVPHPATLARMGYSGIAYGGDGEPKTGFKNIGPDEREPWEPVPEITGTSR